MMMVVVAEVSALLRVLSLKSVMTELPIAVNLTAQTADCFLLLKPMTYKMTIALIISCREGNNRVLAVHWQADHAVC